MKMTNSNCGNQTPWWLNPSTWLPTIQPFYLAEDPKEYLWTSTPMIQSRFLTTPYGAWTWLIHKDQQWEMMKHPLHYVLYNWWSMTWPSFHRWCLIETSTGLRHHDLGWGTLAWTCGHLHPRLADLVHQHNRSSTRRWHEPLVCGHHILPERAHLLYPMGNYCQESPHPWRLWFWGHLFHRYSGSECLAMGTSSCPTLHRSSRGRHQNQRPPSEPSTVPDAALFATLLYQHGPPDPSRLPILCPPQCDHKDYQTWPWTQRHTTYRCRTQDPPTLVVGPWSLDGPWWNAIHPDGMSNLSYALFQTRRNANPMDQWLPRADLHGDVDPRGESRSLYLRYGPYPLGAAGSVGTYTWQTTLPLSLPSSVSLPFWALCSPACQTHWMAHLDLWHLDHLRILAPPNLGLWVFRGS